MPYIAQKASHEDRQKLNPFIERLKQDICRLSNKNPKNIPWPYLRYSALKVIEQCSLNAAFAYQGKRALRYWLIVDQAGIASNIAFELFDRIIKPYSASESIYRTPFCCYEFSPETFFAPFPENIDELDNSPNELIDTISEIAGPSGYNYDGAYCGLVNYSLTELMPKVLIKFKTKLNLKDYAMLVNFWFHLAVELYQKHARPYEDEQIGKNGDVDVYRKILIK